MGQESKRNACNQQVALRVLTLGAHTWAFVVFVSTQAVIAGQTDVSGSHSRDGRSSQVAEHRTGIVPLPVVCQYSVSG